MNWEEMAIQSQRQLAETEVVPRALIQKVIANRLVDRDKQVGQILQMTNGDWPTLEAQEMSYLVNVFGETQEIPDEVLERIFYDADLMSLAMLQGLTRFDDIGGVVAVKLWVRCIMICDILKGRRELDGN